MDLIQRSQAGDEKAFASLFHQYKNLVFKTAFLVLGSTDEAEDALSEVFWQVYKSLSTFQPSKGAFTTWLHRITVNHCLNRRRRPRLFTLPLDDLASSLETGISASPEGRLGDEQAIQQALGRLSDKLRVAVILRYYSELSYAEMAKILDIPIGTVKSRLDLALKSLRQELESSTNDASAFNALCKSEVAP